MGTKNAFEIRERPLKEQHDLVDRQRYTSKDLCVLTSSIHTAVAPKKKCGPIERNRRIIIVWTKEST